MHEPAQEARDHVASLFDEVDRLMDRAPIRSHASARLPDDDRRGDPARRFRADAERALDLAFDALADVGELVADTWKGLTRDRRDEMVLGPVVAGSNCRTTLWIHNSTTRPVAELLPIMTQLVRHDGRGLEGAAVVFDPPTVASLASHSSESIEVSVDVPADMPAGSYYGTVLVSGLPDVRLPVTLVVDP